MPNPGAEESLTKITINVFTKDLEALKRQEGFGWSGKIRELIRRYLNERRSSQGVGRKSESHSRDL